MEWTIPIEDRDDIKTIEKVINVALEREGDVYVGPWYKESFALSVITDEDAGFYPSLFPAWYNNENFDDGVYKVRKLVCALFDNRFDMKYQLLMQDFENFVARFHEQY